MGPSAVAQQSLTCLLFNLAVGIYFFMLAADAPHAITKKTWIVYPWQNLPWSFARLGFWVYIISVAQTTPRTGDRIYIPKGRHMNIFLRIIVFAEVFGTTPFAAAAGYAYDQYGNGKGFYILSAVVNVINAILSATLATGIYFYGKQMLIIVEHSMQGLRASMTTIGLSSVATQRSSVEVRLSKALIKMKMMNMASMGSLIWYSSVLTLYAFIPDTMLAARWWSIWQCTGGYLGVPLILWTSQVVILWAEFFPPETPGDCASIIKSLHDGGTQTVKEPACDRMSRMSTDHRHTKFAREIEPVSPESPEEELGDMKDL
ncbi:hypothetical protein HDU90_002211 [Geranomyces variabilis]|nr:hypothetical protein HDU90_002211 [Geranomyces variabilis]